MVIILVRIINLMLQYNTKHPSCSFVQRLKSNYATQNQSQIFVFAQRISEWAVDTSRFSAAQKNSQMYYT